MLLETTDQVEDLSEMTSAKVFKVQSSEEFMEL